jgi:hypothetical protein
VTLNLLATQSGMTIDNLVHQLATGLRVDDHEARGAVDEVVQAGFATVADTVRLTSDGEARYERIRGGIDDITRRLYRDLPTEDLVVARRVLEVLTDRARAELAIR